MRDIRKELFKELSWYTSEAESSSTISYDSTPGQPRRGEGGRDRRGGERDRQTLRQRERERNTESDREGERDRQTLRQTVRERETDRH